MSLISVRFLENYGCYNAGECAGFDPAKANELIQRRIAALVEPVSVDPVQKKLEILETPIAERVIVKDQPKVATKKSRR